LIGIVTGVGAVFGILGSLTYPYLRKNLGKYSTGNIGFGLNVLFLLFCVGSVFGPGTPFDPISILRPFQGIAVDGSDLGEVHETLEIPQLWAEKLNVFYFIFGIILARYGK
jgi:hypothetical protein